MVLSVSLFSAMDALVKLLAERYPVLQIIFFRSLFGFLPLLWPLMRAGGWRSVLATRRLSLHIARGVAGVLSLLCFFMSYRFLGLAEAVTLFFISPLVMTALSAVILTEPVGWRRWTAVTVGLVGVLVIVQPGGGLFVAAALLPIGGALTYAVATVTIRRLATTDSALTIVFYFTLTTTVLAAIPLPAVWQTPDSALDWGALVLTGLLGGGAQLALTRAFRLAPVAVLAPFEYLSLVWALGWGWLIWAELPGLWTWIGGAVVAGSGLYVLHREAGLARRPPTVLT